MNGELTVTVLPTRTVALAVLPPKPMTLYTPGAL